MFRSSIDRESFNVLSPALTVVTERGKVDIV